MRLMLIPVLALLFLLGAGLTPVVQEAESEAPVAAADSKEALLEHMKAIEVDLKKLRRSLRRPESNPDSLERVAVMQGHAFACKTMNIPMATRVPEAERAAFLADYRKDMAVMIIELLNLEIALLNDDNERAQEVYKALKELEAAGHEKFMPEE